MQKMTGRLATVRATTCPSAAMESICADGLGPGQGWVTKSAVSFCARVSRRHVEHRHSPPVCCQLWPPSVLCVAPSVARCGLVILSLGRGGNACVTLAIVRTTNLARLRVASSMAASAGLGRGWCSTALLASTSAQLFPMASCLSSSDVACSGWTCAFTLRVDTNLFQLSSNIAMRMIPA